MVPPELNSPLGFINPGLIFWVNMRYGKSSSFRFQKINELSGGLSRKLRLIPGVSKMGEWELLGSVILTYQLRYNENKWDQNGIMRRLTNPLLSNYFSVRYSATRGVMGNTKCHKHDHSDHCDSINF